MARALRFKSLNHCYQELGANIRLNGYHPDSVTSKTATKSADQKMSPLSPQSVLWRAVADKFAEFEPKENYKHVVPGRKFEADIAFPSIRLALEVDGWCFHGKFKAGFKRDREKSKLFTLNGWRTLNFTSSEIYNDLPGCLSQVEVMITVFVAETSHLKY